MKYILVLIGLIFSGFSFTQLEAEYYGTYINEDADQVFTIYSVDEVGEHCFLVDYQMYHEGELIVEDFGNGHCDDSDGVKALFYFERFTTPCKVSFFHDEEGNVIMDVLFPDNQNTIRFYLDEDLSEFIEEEGMEGYESEEIIFRRKDDATLILFDFEGQIGFTLNGVASEFCQNTEVGGILLPLDETMTVLRFTDEEGCEIKMTTTEEGILIEDKNCESYRDKSCANWTGMYYID